MVLNPIPKILDRVMEEIQSTLQPAETTHENLVEGKVNNLSGHLVMRCLFIACVTL
jgi:hypothetical protein